MSRPRIRTVKPEHAQDERVGRLSRDARLLFFTGLVTMADDEGRLRAMPALIIGHVFPYDADVTSAKLRKWLDEIEREGMIVRYEHQGTPYIAIRRWKRHQRIDRPAESTLPAPPDPGLVAENSTNDRRMIDEASSSVPAASRARADRIGSGSGTEAPLPPRGNRKRDRERYEEHLATFAAEHFPGAHPQLVGAGARQLRDQGQAATVDALRSYVERWAA